MLKGLFIWRSRSSVDNQRVKAFVASASVGAATGSSWLRAGLLAMLWASLALQSAQASDRHDHERARAAVQAGEVLPLPTLLQRLQQSHPGQVLELELEGERGRWVYEVKLLQANGQLLKLELDASTGRVLRVKRKDDRNDDRKDDRKEDRKSERKGASSEAATR